MYSSKLVKIIFLVSTLFSDLLFAQSNDKLNSKNNSVTNKIYNIQIKKDYMNHRTLVYLLVNNVEVDSIKLNNINLEYDSLIRFENNWWLYIFSECTDCDLSLESKSQFILTQNNGKLQIAFVSIREYNGRRDKMNSPFISNISDTNQYLINIKKQYTVFEQIKIDSNFFYGKNKLEETHYSYQSGDSLEEQGFIKIYNIKLDSSKKVFYNERKIINANCSFELKVNGPQVKKRLYNEEILMLSFYTSCFAYYNGKWYSYFNNSFRPMDIITSTCLNKCEM